MVDLALPTARTTTSESRCSLILLYIKKLEKLNFAVTQTVGRQLKSEPRCQTRPVWALAPCSTSCLPQLLMNNQISHEEDLTPHTKVLVHNPFLVSSLWCYQPVLAGRKQDESGVSWLGRSMGVVGACQGKFLIGLQIPLLSCSFPLGLTVSSSPQ